MSRPIALANSASGTGSDDEEFDAWCAARDIDVRATGDDLQASIRDAASAAPTYLAVNGGDGTLRCAVEVLAGGDVALLTVPGGTFNHFSKSLGIADLAAVSAAVDGGTTRSVPVAEVNGEVFLNTCAIGWYPDMVRTRERLREKLPRPIAAVAAFWAHALKIHRFTVEIDGDTHLAWLLWAGNGHYGTDAGTVSERADIDEGVLDIRLALADRRFAKLHAVWDLVRGRLRESELLERFVTSTPVTAKVSMRHVAAALDAEVIDLTTPLTLTPAARHVTVLVPPAT